MPSRWDAATRGWRRRVFHYPPPTLMSRNFRLPRTIELQPLALTPLKMRKVEIRFFGYQSRGVGGFSCLVLGLDGWNSAGWRVGDESHAWFWWAIRN